MDQSKIYFQTNSPHSHGKEQHLEEEEKKIHVSCEGISRYFSSHWREGGGIDGRVSPRTGVSERIVLSHFKVTSRGYTWCGNVFLLFVLLNLTLGGKQDFLMT